jgi:hypothetical protein
MKCCEILFSKILNADHSLFDDILWREEVICILCALVLSVAKSVLANRGIVDGIMAWSNDVQLQLDDGGENM